MITTHATTSLRHTVTPGTPEEPDDPLPFGRNSTHLAIQLGLALGELYQKERSEARKLTNRARREEYLRRLGFLSDRPYGPGSAMAASQCSTR